MRSTINVTVSGPPGVGKTTVARIIRDALKANCIDFNYFADPDGRDAGDPVNPNCMHAMQAAKTLVVINEKGTKPEAVEHG